MVKLEEPCVAIQDWLCSSFVLLLWKEQLVPAVPWAPSQCPCPFGSLAVGAGASAWAGGGIALLWPSPVAPGSAACPARRPALRPPACSSAPRHSKLWTSLCRCSSSWPLKSDSCIKPPDSDCFSRLMIS